MCIAGDSIDLQWIDVIEHQLRRAAFLASSPISSVSVDTLDFGKGGAGCTMDVPTWWGMLKDVKQLDALDKDGHRLARFRYFKFYQMVPGYLEFIRKNCDILVINLSLHWKPSTGKGDDPKSYLPLAIEAGAVYLSNFSNNGKIAIWRETSPQYGKFDKFDGTFDILGRPCLMVLSDI